MPRSSNIVVGSNPIAFSSPLSSDIVLVREYIKRYGIDILSHALSNDAYKEYELYPTKRTSGIKLRRLFGLEFTFEKKDNSDAKHYHKIKQLEKMGVRCYNDGGCLEINTPLFIYLEDVIDYWVYIKNLLGKEYVTRNPDSTGGGTHIRVSDTMKIGESDYKFRLKLATIIRNRPWLTFGFQHPDDDDSSEPVAQSDKMVLKLKSPFVAENLYNKSYSISEDQVRCALELRFFDTVDNVEDLRNFLMVTNYLIKLAEKSKEKQIEKSNYDELSKELYVTGISDFEKFIKSVGIKYSSEKFKLRLWNDYEEIKNKINKITLQRDEINLSINTFADLIPDPRSVYKHQDQIINISYDYQDSLKVLKGILSITLMKYYDCRLL